MSTNPANTAMDIGAAGLVVSSLIGWLPPIAAMLGICWYAVLFYDRFIKKKTKT